MRVYFSASVIAFGLLAAQGLTAADRCSADFNWDHLATAVESREQRLPAATDTKIDAGQNGGIHVYGWNQSDVLVKACIHTAASSRDEAEAMLKEIKIARGSGDIRPDGPAIESHHWSVSYEVWLPRNSNLEMHSHNGGISLESVEGRIRFHTQNGGIRITDVAGDVDGSTTNGGVHIELKGTSWHGTGLRAETTNGGITMVVPSNYSADVEASTVNGGLHTDFPALLDGRTMTVKLGSGGAPIRARTTNGGVHITKA